MRARAWLLALVGTVLAVQADAYENHLQFRPNPGYRGLVVAGYGFKGNTVVGNCSYYTLHGGSGRGGGYHVSRTDYKQTCAWDLAGNLLGITPGEPAAPPPLYTKGSLTVYARNAKGDFTGIDAANEFGGFVNTPGAHYSWETANAYAVLRQQLYTFTATLVSDGDVALRIATAEASALQGRAAVKSTTCIGNIPRGAACGVTVAYDPTRLRSPTGLAYDTLTISVISDSAQANDFVQSYTIVLNRRSDGDD